MNPESWEVLDLDPSASVEQVRKRFRKLALRHHPDKGGSPHIFNMLKNAYKDILTFHAGLNQKGHHQLRQQHKERTHEQDQQSYRGYLEPKNLNMDRFNSFFVEHRLNDPNEHGYGHMMEQSNNTRVDDAQLAKTKIQHFPDQQIILYQDPQEVFGCSSNVGNLGDDNSNFTAAWNQKVTYTDYLEAHSTPVDRTIIPSRDSFNSIDQLKANRGKSLKANKKEQKHHQKISEQTEKKERHRMKRTNKRDTKMTSNYQKIQNLLGYQ